MKNLTFEEVLITPELASSFLQLNKNNNRLLRESKVKQYSLDIVKGRWKRGTGESIKISEDGILIDGQHRLRAVLMAGVPVYMHVSKGHSLEVFTVLDTGAVRNSSDVLHIENVKNATKIAAGIRMAIIFSETGTPRSHRIIPNNEILDVYNSNDIYWTGLSNKATNWYTSFGKILSTTMIIALWHSFSKKNVSDADEFFNQLCGKIPTINSTINVLRNKLLADKVGAKRLPEYGKAAIIIRAWNYFRTGKSVQILKYDSTNEFPNIQ
jgi:hypothetical protein